MKKRLFIPILFCFITLFSCSNNNNYITYHKKINEAELYINNKDYGKALSTYQDLFKDFPNLFYKDLHNACLCAIELNKTNEAFNFAEKLVTHGYLLTDFEDSGFIKLKSNNKQWSKFTNDFPLFRKEYLKILDTIERREYKKLYEIDQNAATSSNIKFQDSLFYNNAIEFLKLVSENGFPQYFLHKDTLNTKLFVMLRHFCGLENRLHRDRSLYKDTLYYTMNNLQIKKITKRALTTGFIQPQMYSDIVSYFDANPFGEIRLNIDIDNEQIFPFINKTYEEVQEINKLRDSIGLFKVGEVSADMLNSTWYGQYPFKEIKAATEACDTCHTKKDYLLLKLKIAGEARDKYNETKKNKAFILTTLEDIRHIYIIHEYLDEKNLRPE